MFTYLRACTCLACAHTCMPPSPKQAGKLAYVLQGQNACQARAARLPGKDKCMHALSLYTLCLDAAHTPPSDFTYPAYCRPWHTCTLLPSVPTCTPVHPRVPMCTPVHPRVPMCTPVHPRVPMCTFSSVYAHPHRAPTIQVHANTGLVCCHTKLGDLEMLTLIIAKHTTLSAFPCTHLAPPSPSTQHAHTTLCLSLSLACASLCSQCVFKGLPLATACAPLLAQPASPSTLSLWLTLVSTCTSFDPQPMNIPASTFARPSTLSL